MNCVNTEIIAQYDIECDCGQSCGGGRRLCGRTALPVDGQVNAIFEYKWVAIVAMSLFFFRGEAREGELLYINAEDREEKHGPYLPLDLPLETI